ncbi:hypothetical protein [Microbacterium binotii]|uniref:hypothetical protein n=1 Tax=Microbacterium binotii TaxID=462710 RepID=UPI001F252983|nr:hypothetical protein [Microbacterium binotii]UIN30635.1 hypothetical protein LXM64_00060 [Microbacterium binotii]
MVLVQASVLDVIENALGERGDRVAWDKLARTELENLRDRLLEFSEADAETPTPEGTYLMSGTFSRYWEDPLSRGEITDALLYYPQLLVLDPFADFFADTSVLPETRDLRYTHNRRETMRISAGGKVWANADSAQHHGDDWEGISVRLSEISRNLYELESPIRSGVIILRNQWAVLQKRRTALETSVRFDVRSARMQTTMRELHNENAKLPLWDNLRGFHITGSGALHPADVPWEFQHFFLFLAKTLAIADSANATYAPSWPGDLQLLEAKVDSTPAQGYPPQVLAQISKIVLPATDVAIREAANIRASSSDFADWRAKLREFARAASADNPRELEERANDVFQPEVRRIERELSGRKQSAAKDSVTELLLYGTISTVATAATSENFALGATVGAAAAAATGVVSWIRNAYRRPQLHGADAVLAALARSDRK